MKQKRFWSILLLFAVVVVTAGTIGLSGHATAQSDDAVAQADDVFVARVYYDTIADLEALATYDMWEFNNLQEQYVLVSMDDAIYNELTKAGWRVVIDSEATAQLAPELGNRTFYGGYRTVDELHADMATVNAAHPDLTEIVDYGDSYCKAQGGCTTLGGDNQPGFDLKAIRVTNEAIGGDKPVFFLVAGIHSREITTPELAMRMLDWLVDGYGVDADATWIVDHHEVWIIPSLNPDGHWIVELGTQPPYNGNPFYQRKNANRSNGCNTWPPTSFTQYGVDLNRNHSFEWNTGGSSSAPCDQTYRGPSAASENEVDQFEDLVRAHIPDQRGPNPTDAAPRNTTGILITLHSYSELVLWPWGNVTTPAPNKAGLKAIGDKLATYNGYTSCQPSLCLYITSGTTDDWSYGELGIPSYTIEVGTQFMPPYGQIDSIQWPDNGPALQYAAKIARTPYRLAFGPDALAPTVVDNGNGTVTLTAVIDDTNNGNKNIRRAVYFVDSPYWDGGSATLMAALDGAYNSPVETAQATIDISGWSSGRHIVFVHGMDRGRSFGPATAVFIDVP
ncbi:MAG: hypothetical protein M9941_06895 [Anaerolineae bacterium]|nr:hypothetical protein [Anaerolineae bacterium]MCO5193620.1 hypothetical protein [Anaerolineae bacterium]MCO5197461.1 hypothetical protein [Anaerolineae bacterium]